MKTIFSFSVLFYFSILLFLHGCVKNRDVFYTPSHPYDSASLIHCDVPVKGLDNLLTLLEKRFQARTLPEYLEVQEKVDDQIGRLVGAINLASGVHKYGDPGFVNPQGRAVRVLLGFSQMRTQTHLNVGIEIVEDMKHQIKSEQD